MRKLLAAGLVLGHLSSSPRARSTRSAGGSSSTDRGPWPVISKAPDFDALDADRAHHNENPSTTASAVAAATSEDPPTAAAPATAAPVPDAPAASPRSAHFVPAWSDFRGPDRDGRYTSGPNQHRLAGQRVAAALEAADRAGLRVVRRRRWTRVHDRAAAPTGGRRRATTSRPAASSGRNGWDAEFVETMGGDGPRATPTYHEGRSTRSARSASCACLDARYRRA